MRQQTRGIWIGDRRGDTVYRCVMPRFYMDTYGCRQACCHLTATQKKTNSCFRWLHTCFGYEGETGESVCMVIIEDKPIDNHINEKVSSRALHWYSCSYVYLKPITAQSIWSEIYLKRNWKDFFPLKYEILSYEKCLNFWISSFQTGDIFWIVTILNLKDPLKYFFLFPNGISGR